MAGLSRRHFLALAGSGLMAACGGTSATQQTPSGSDATSSVPAATPTPAAFAATIDPLTKKPFPNPNVPFPTFQYARIIQDQGDGRILALDGAGNPVGRAISQRGLPWRWTATPHLIEDYSPSELADALGFTIGSHGFPQVVNDPRWVENFLSIANKIRIDEFWNTKLFVPNINWRRILDNWDQTKSDISRSVIPFESEVLKSGGISAVESLSRFAEQYNLPVVASKLYWWGDFRDELYDPAYSMDEKRQMVEFMSKVKLLKWKGRVHEWTTTPEMATGYEPWVDARQRQLLIDLGGIDMMHNINVWAKQTDAEVTTTVVEDRLLDNQVWSVSRRVSQRFWDMLDQFGAKGTPIDRIAPENNFWIYDPPKKATMVDVLQRIKGMGFGISVAQTTITVSDTPFDKGRPRTVPPIQDKEAAQAEIARDIVSAYFETGAEAGFHSTSDVVDWIALAVNIPDANSTIVDKNYRPKKAYFAIRDYLKSKLS